MVDLCARIGLEMLDYRVERAEVARRCEAIRYTRANLKKLTPRDVGIDVVRALARHLGWWLREDEEGVTVPVADLLPYFRRPVVRALLEAKRAQCGLA